MKKVWVILLISAVFLSALALWNAKPGIAKEKGETIGITKPEKFYSQKLSVKIDEVLNNQRLIIQELTEIKGALAE